MPQFFFDCDDTIRLSRDDDGQAHPDRHAAREAALRLLPSLARDRLLDGEGPSLRLMLRDEAGLVIFAATMSRTDVAMH